MNAKENLRQFHGFTGNRFIVTEGPDKGAYDATSEGKLGEFCKELDNHTYNVYNAGYEDGNNEGYFSGYYDGMKQGKKLGAEIAILGVYAIGCIAVSAYLLSKSSKKSKLKQPCLKKESE